MSIAIVVLGTTLPSTPWIDENRAIYWSIIAFVALAVGITLWLVGIKLSKSETVKPSLLEDIKADLIILGNCEKEVAIKKTQEQYPNESTKKIRSDFTEYVTGTVPSLLKSFADVSNKEHILDSLIKFFVGMGDILDINGYGLKSDLSNNTTYKNTKEDIAQKQQRLRKRGRALTQTHIRKAGLLTYGLNSTILFRHIYRSTPKLQEFAPLEFNTMMESLERVADKFLAEMLNNLDVDWGKIIKIDFDEL